MGVGEKVGRMNRRTIYIAGPMRGINEGNREAFDLAARRLSIEGWHAINPVRIGEALGLHPEPETPKVLDACMEAELATIPHLDAIYLLHGWERSAGARKELLVALQHKLMVFVEGGAAAE